MAKRSVKVHCSFVDEIEEIVHSDNDIEWSSEFGL